ncbi:uncharacterized protein MEPE_02238 [Melanopsichium pennsylvanicum]|uniref:BAR domain-containing protein n=2 Tax=Melanopsichium pennsylvanicum TaxID=63383 RepID=A0AAJ4XKM5_9BASI|nr:bar domain protein [Melanopsichium pennsylvanicum 4]SNX83531.1 uncharacterized protein MEPE_02238 [Melanopsichium pennsylvanicum]
MPPNLSSRPKMGKLRSWLSSSNKSEEQQDLASEVEARKKGIDSLYTSTEAYWSYLGKKKPLTFDASSVIVPLDDTSSTTSGTVSANKPERKMLPVEALGLAMTSFSTAFPEGSQYGSCLGLLGEAHLKLGNLQNAFTKDTSHIFLARIARSKATLDSFTAALKKLDAATARLESAQSKIQKSKKEKRELEEELRLAKAAYDEAVTDVEVRGEALGEAEGDDLVVLTEYMQAQLDYVSEAQAVMEQAKAMWGEVPPGSVSRSGSSTPVTRPRSLSGPKLRPSISRRSSAKDAGDVPTTTSSSRFGSRSSLSLSASDGTPSATDDTKKEKDKKSRLRMPSFSGASDALTSAATQVGGTFTRSRSSTLLAGMGGKSGGEASPDKDKEYSKWNFKRGSKKEEKMGFLSMDEADKLEQYSPKGNNAKIPPALPARDYVRTSVSASDVHLGIAHDHDGESSNGHRIGASPDLRLSLPETDFEEEVDFGAGRGPSPFSPDAAHGVFSATNRLSSPAAYETIHERGESNLSTGLHLADSTYLGGSIANQHLSLHHTGLSSYSDNMDPFGGAMSPQATGGKFDESEMGSDEQEERQGLTAGRVTNSTGERKKVDAETNESKGTWRSVLNGNGGGSVRGPPPPVPSSASFLSKSKQRLAPPPPPLPLRNSN